MLFQLSWKDWVHIGMILLVIILGYACIRHYIQVMKLAFHTFHYHKTTRWYNWMGMSLWYTIVMIIVLFFIFELFEFVEYI